MDKLLIVLSWFFTIIVTVTAILSLVLIIWLGHLAFTHLGIVGGLIYIFVVLAILSD